MGNDSGAAMYPFMYNIPFKRARDNDALTDLRGKNWLCLADSAFALDVNRDLLVNGSPRLALLHKLYDQRPDLFDVTSKTEVTDETTVSDEIADAILSQEFGEDADKILKYYNQTTSYISYRALFNFFFNEGTVPNPDKGRVLNSEKRVNLYRQENKIFVEAIFYDMTLVSPADDSSISIPGKVRTLVELTPQGFKLIQFQTSNKFLADVIMQPTWLDKNYERIKEFAEAQENFLTEWRKNTVFKVLKPYAMHVYQNIANAADKKGANIPLLTKVLSTTTALLAHPENITSLKAYLQLIKQVPGHLSTTQIVAGSMLMFAGAAIVVASIGFAVATFGFSTPLSSLGLVLGLAIVAGGGVVGATALVSGAAAAFFGRTKGTSQSMLSFAKQQQKQTLVQGETQSSLDESSSLLKPKS